ncbi:membrane protein [Bacteroidales bacterium]|nr:membrane protein [Bacteroidales bacterium]
MWRFTILLLFLSSLLSAQEVYDLKRCIELGLERNYDIKIVRNNQEIADNNFSIGNAGYLPQLDLDGSYSGSLSDREQKLRDVASVSSNNGVHDQRLNTGINISWTVFDGFNIQTSYNRLRELQQVGQLNTRLTIENFISNIAVEYYNYVQQNIRLKNLLLAVKLSRERLRIVEARYNIGSMSRLDLQQAKVDFNADSSKQIKQYEILFVSQTRLNMMMAADNVEQVLTITDSIIGFNDALDKNEIWQKALNANSYLLLSQKEQQLSILELKAAQSQNYPYLKLNGGYAYTKNIYEVGASDWQKNIGFNYGLSIGYNLFDGFNRKRKQKNAKIQIQNTALQYQHLQLSVEADLSNAWMAYKNNIRLQSLEKENLEAAHENYDIAIERYKLGDLSGIELREAQNSLLEAEERLVQAEYSIKLCEISLIQISGELVSYVR